MKYIITEDQYDVFKGKQIKNLEKIKPYLIKYWNENGPIKTFDILPFFGITKAFEKPVTTLLIEWYGGGDVVEQKISDLILGKVFRAESGSYDFKYKIDSVNVFTDMIFYEVIVDGGGKIFVDTGDNLPITNIYDAYHDNDIWWEVNLEIIEIINEREISEKVKNTLGLKIYMDTDIRVLPKNNNEFN